MTAQKQLLRNGAERAEYGCPPQTAFNEACDLVLTLDETFRLVSYSTPGSVFQDLQGGRNLVFEGQPEYTGGGAAVSQGNAQPSGEAMICARVGMAWLLHPRLHSREAVDRAARKAAR